MLRQLVPVAEDMGFSPEQMEAALSSNKALAEQLTWAAFRMMLVEQVLGAAKPA